MPQRDGTGRYDYLGRDRLAALREAGLVLVRQLEEAETTQAREKFRRAMLGEDVKPPRRLIRRLLRKLGVNPDSQK